MSTLQIYRAASPQLLIEIDEKTTFQQKYFKNTFILSYYAIKCPCFVIFNKLKIYYGNT